METYQALAISLGLGLLVGLQREWKESEIAGIRTFPLLTLLGTLSVLTSGGEVAWLSSAGLLAITIGFAIANIAKFRSDLYQFGMTTEVSGLLMYVVGCALGAGLIGPAIVTAGVTAVLLHWKKWLHGMVGSMAASDIRAVMNLALIALVILPILPDETYGPYDVLNPFSIWRMVVLIVGISLTAYVAYRLLGAKVGAILGGLLGGLISSTATTVSCARQTKGSPETSAMAALVIVIASMIVNVRILFEVGVVAPSLLQVVFWPMSMILLLMFFECVLLYLPQRNETADLPEQSDPAQLKAAIVFGALYAVVLFLVAAAKENFGSEAIYLVAGISGLTDVDAITLSTAKMYKQDRISDETAWRVILIATMSNLGFKTALVGFLGSRRLLFYVSIAFAIAIAGGVALLTYWPAEPWPMPIAFEPAHP